MTVLTQQITLTLLMDAFADTEQYEHMMMSPPKHDD